MSDKAEASPSSPEIPDVSKLNLSTDAGDKTGTKDSVGGDTSVLSRDQEIWRNRSLICSKKLDKIKASPNRGKDSGTEESIRELERTRQEFESSRNDLKKSESIFDQFTQQAAPVESALGLLDHSTTTADQGITTEAGATPVRPSDQAIRTCPLHIGSVDRREAMMIL